MYRILFVEDDEAIRFLVSKYHFWKQSDFSVAGEAGNGKEALALMAQKTYDVVITDIRMPVMDGLELCRQMKRRGYEMPVILASTYSDFAYAKEGMRLGALEYIEKPYSCEKMEEALEIARNYLEQNGDRQTEMLYHKLLEVTETTGGIAAEIIKGEELRFQGQTLKVRATLEKQLELVLEYMGKQAPWIPVLDKMDVCIGERVLTDVERVLQELRYLIDRYHLEKPDSMMVRITTIISESVLQEHIQDIVAEEMGFSKDYLAKQFRGKIGITTSEYCMRVKMEYAKRLLKDTNKKVYEIGEELGYTTVDYFTRLFKNYTGCTPAYYRKYGDVV